MSVAFKSWKGFHLRSLERFLFLELGYFTMSKKYFLVISASELCGQSRIIWISLRVWVLTKNWQKENHPLKGSGNRSALVGKITPWACRPYSSAPSPTFSSDAVFHSIFCFRLTSDKPERMGMVCLQDKKRGRKSIKFTTLSPEFFGSHQSSLLKLLLSYSFQPTSENRLRHGIYQICSA